MTSNRVTIQVVITTRSQVLTIWWLQAALILKGWCYGFYLHTQLLPLGLVLVLSVDIHLFAQAIVDNLLSHGNCMIQEPFAVMLLAPQFTNLERSRHQYVNIKATLWYLCSTQYTQSKIMCISENRASGTMLVSSHGQGFAASFYEKVHKFVWEYPLGHVLCFY